MKKNHRAFSLVELLVAIVLVAILVSIAFPMMRQVQDKKNQMTCIGNLRQIGVGMVSYSTDEGRGSWAYFEALNINNAGRGSWSGPTVWDSQYKCFNGLGKAYPYLEKKEVFVCPVNRPQKRSILALPSWRNASVSVNGSYIARGFDQSWVSTTGEHENSVGKMQALIGHRAVASCFFMNAPGNPNFPISWHSEKWPVLYGDGSIQVVSKAPEAITRPLANANVWGGTSLQWRFWDYFDSKR